MKTVLKICLSMLVFICGSLFASGNSSAAPNESATLNIGERTYSGTYTAATRSISIEIDGLKYKGNYASIADDNAGPMSGVVTGKWGRAFLFASSSKTLRCELDKGFPEVSGKCHDAGGRLFYLKPGVTPQPVTAR